MRVPHSNNKELASHLKHLHVCFADLFSDACVGSELNLCAGAKLSSITEAPSHAWLTDRISQLKQPCQQHRRVRTQTFLDSCVPHIAGLVYVVVCSTRSCEAFDCNRRGALNSLGNSQYCAALTGLLTLEQH
jgi:hypothetical protein